MFYLPVILLFLVFYFFVLGGLFLFLKIGLISFAFSRLGLSAGAVFLLLFLCLIGSAINIPVRRIHSDQLFSEELVDFFGWRFRIPAIKYQNTTVLAVNLGGAVIPSLVSVYLVLRWLPLFLYFLVATVFVALMVHRVARPIRGLGIATPALFPPLVAALTALLLSLVTPGGLGIAPIIAYVSGTLGTLIGADLMNLKKIADLGAPVASIGGAGTFDGVFITGIVAVVLTSL